MQPLPPCVICPSIPRSSRLRSGRNLAIALAVASVICVAAMPARADFVTTTFSNVNPGEIVTITMNGASESGWAGVYNFTNTSSNTGGLSSSFGGFCIDIGQDIYANQTVQFTVASLPNAPVPGKAMGLLRAELIGELWYQDYSLIGTSNSNAAAFQIAIWEIINETQTNNGKLDLNVLTGAFTVSDSDTTTLNTANSWLGALDLSGNGPQDPGLIALTSMSYQDYAVQGVVTPAPAGWILGLVGSMVLVLQMAWRSRKQSFALMIGTRL